MADPLLAGKANFGFVSKYKKGTSIPDGQTQFQFPAGGLNFHSTSYEWLVVAGANAKFKGEGTINGTGNYGFLLTATDGQVSGGGGVDKFRIKVWDKDNGDAVVYDNQLGEADDSYAGTAIGGGSIVIHNNAKSAQPATATAGEQKAFNAAKPLKPATATKAIDAVLADADFSGGDLRLPAKFRDLPLTYKPTAFARFGATELNLALDEPLFDLLATARL